MQQPLFDVHAKILHKGQYLIKPNSVDVPIKQFSASPDLEQSVQERIHSLQLEISDLEEKLREKRRLSQEQAEKILENAHDEAKKVLEDAEQHAFDRVQRSVQDKERLLQQTAEEIERLKTQAQKDSEDIVNDAHKESVKIKEQAHSDGYQDGLKQGIEKGKDEVIFTVDRLHGIIAETARERERILVHSENQVVNLLLTMVRKVVKKLSVEHQDIVVENIKSALELLRGAMTLFIRVSPQDFNYSQSFKKELVQMIEKRADLKFIEDPTVEPGGVYIETDMGDVDATLRSQLEELENQMHFYMPVKVYSPEQKKQKQEQEAKKAESLEQTQEQEAKKDIPLSEFAQREEYRSNVEITASPSNTETAANHEFDAQMSTYQENTSNSDDTPNDDIIV